MNGERCRKCCELPEDILMLACNHDLCLKCAAQRVRHEPGKKDQLPSILCEFCCTRTEIDEETLFELQKHINVSVRRNPNGGLRGNSREESREKSLSRKSQAFVANVLEPRPSLSNLHNIPVAARHTTKDSFEGSRAVSRRAPTVNQENSMVAYAKQPPKRQCSNHPDQELMYYCFDCNCECICPECVIHGEHKTHEVQTIKKSLPLVKSQLNNFNQSIQKSIDDLLTRQSEVLRTIDQAKSKFDHAKLEIQKAFNNLVDEIHQKEKAMLRKCDIAFDTVVNGYRLAQQTLLERIKERKASLSLISSTLLKDEIALLNVYAGNISTFERLGRLSANEDGQIKAVRNIPSSEWIVRQIHEFGQRFSKIDLEEPRETTPSVSSFSCRSMLSHDQQHPSRSQLFRYLPAADADREAPDDSIPCE